jgi:hypothetical protein
MINLQAFLSCYHHFKKRVYTFISVIGRKNTINIIPEQRFKINCNKQKTVIFTTNFGRRCEPASGNNKLYKMTILK